MLLSLIFQLAFVHREVHQTAATEIQRMIDGFAVLFARGVAWAHVPGKKAKS
jgi:hypothetical protein